MSRTLTLVIGVAAVLGVWIGWSLPHSESESADRILDQESDGTLGLAHNSPLLIIEPEQSIHRDHATVATEVLPGESLADWRRDPDQLAAAKAKFLELLPKVRAKCIEEIYQPGRGYEALNRTIQLPGVQDSTFGIHAEDITSLDPITAAGLLDHLSTGYGNRVELGNNPLATLDDAQRESFRSALYEYPLNYPVEYLLQDLIPNHPSRWAPEFCDVVVEARTSALLAISSLHFERRILRSTFVETMKALNLTRTRGDHIRDLNLVYPTAGEFDEGISQANRNYVLAIQLAISNNQWED